MIDAKVCACGHGHEYHYGAHTECRVCYCQAFVRPIPNVDTTATRAVHDPVSRPVHYTSHPSGVECIDVVEHMPFNLGNAVKYIWRAALKGAQEQDLKKAIWYLERELKRVGK